EIEKARELGEQWRQVVFLPEVGLQHRRMVRHSVEDIGCRQPVAFQLQPEVQRDHLRFPSRRSRESVAAASATRFRANAGLATENLEKRLRIKRLAASPGDC